MSVEQIKHYILNMVEQMDEADERFLKQISTFIRRYDEEKRGH